jgi:hypothetical protein
VGVETAAHARVSAFTGGVMTVEVDSAPLLHELVSFRKRDLVEVLRRTVGFGLVDVKFRVAGRRPRASSPGVKREGER